MANESINTARNAGLPQQRITIKQQIVKVYNTQKQFLDVWRDCPIMGDQSNSNGVTAAKFAVNTITSQVTVTLPRPFDNFDEAGDRRGRGTVGAGNIVQFWVVDNGTLTSGRLVYQGYIDGYIPAIDQNGEETIQVILTPFDTVLGDVKFIGTVNFGTPSSPTTYIDPVQMFDWPFGSLIAATSATPVTAGTTNALTLSNVTNIFPGSTLYLQGTGADSAKTNGPLSVASVNAGTNVVTFTGAIPTNSYANLIIVAAVAPTTSATVVTGGVTAAISVASATNLAPNMPIGIFGTGVDSGKSESPTILSIVGTTVTFTAPLTNSYSATIGICPTLAFNTITNHPYPYPLTLDPSNPTSSGVTYQAQFHNQSLAEWFEAVRTIAPTNWFWRTNHDTMTITFAQAHANADYTFIIGKHCSQPSYQKNYNTLFNDIYVKGTGVTSRATGSDVIQYGQRTKVVVEDRIIDQNTCDRYAAALLALYDRVDYRSTVSIVDSRGDTSGAGFDIEVLRVGQSCRLENPFYNAASTLWDQAVWDEDVWDFSPQAQINQVVTIASETYNFDTVDLELSTLQPSQDRFLLQLAQQYESSQFA